MVVKPGGIQNHDVRSIIKDFTAWESYVGVHLEYTGHYTLLNLDLVAADHGIWGISTGGKSFDFVINGANIEGFDVGVRLASVSDFDDHGTGYRFAFMTLTLAVQQPVMKICFRKI